MIACVDAAYRDSEAVAACVLLHSWTDGVSAGEIVRTVAPVEDYRPGEFYLRELPCILALLRQVREPPHAVVVDGYVWLAEGRPGLGARLYESLGRSTAVVGVAKSRFAGATGAVPVMRGRSARPLYVSAAGIEVEQAAHHILMMHGAHRIPTLLKLADRLSRRRAGEPPVLHYDV